MTSDHDSPQPYEALRLRAEQCRRETGSFNSAPAHAGDAQRLLQELEVHQIELEMQNLELQKARDEAEKARETYQNLYDFAPVGYFTLSREGNIIKANLTGATLLDAERDSLRGCVFARWIPPAIRDDFSTFLAGVFDGKAPGSFELDIRRKAGEPIVVSLEARLGGEGRHCRMMMTDITRRKTEEEAARLLKISTRSNHELKAEVQRRRELEVTLKTARENLNLSLEQSEGQREQLLNLSRALLHAQEEERKRISRELHDQVVQALVAIQYQFELLARTPETDPSRLQAQISRAQGLLEGATDMVHRFAFDLRPSALDDLGLGPALESFAAQFHEGSGIPVTLNLFKGVDKIAPPERTMLYRVAQEAFSNVVRHARAGNVHLRILEHHDGIRMDITDDGVGMDLENPGLTRGRGHLGLIGMKERVEMLGGTFQVLSSRGEYTTIRVDLPVG